MYSIKESWKGNPINVVFFSLTKVSKQLLRKGLPLGSVAQENNSYATCSCFCQRHDFEKEDFSNDHYSVSRRKPPNYAITIDIFFLRWYCKKAVCWDVDLLVCRFYVGNRANMWILKEFSLWVLSLDGISVFWSLYSGNYVWVIFPCLLGLFMSDQ